jgi:chromosome segregation ATPase
MCPVPQVEDELASVGENMKQLEKSAEEAVEREEKLKDRILQLQQKYKGAEARFEYGEMKITKLNHKVSAIDVNGLKRPKHKVFNSRFSTSSKPF